VRPCCQQTNRQPATDLHQKKKKKKKKTNSPKLKKEKKEGGSEKSRNDGHPVYVIGCAQLFKTKNTTYEIFSKQV
jgi:hypothetical protein